jgi:hypothetical protein
MTGIVEDTIAIRREVLWRRLEEAVRGRCLLDDAPVPVDFVVPVELLAEIGTDDAELAGLFEWMWHAASEACWAAETQGDHAAADRYLALGAVYGRLCSNHYERAQRRR